MKKSIRKVGIFGAAALFLCSAVLGVSALSAGSVVADDSAPSMATVIGEKTSNVTVTAATQKGDYTGLLVSPSKLSDEWSAEIDTLFTGNAEITYLLPNRADLSTQLQGDYKHKANAFSVKNIDGDIVASFVIFHEHWSAIEHGSAYMYNAVNDTYWVPYHEWNSANSLSYWSTPNKIQQLYPNRDGNHMQYFNSLAGSYIAPISGTDYVKWDSSTGKYVTGEFLTPESLEGKLTFEYVDGTLTIKTSTYAVDGRNNVLTTATGNGQTLTMGTVTTDLSEGYTVVMHNAPDFGKVGDMNYYEHTHSSAVLLTSVNGFDTLAPEVTVTATEEVISYDGESVVDEKNVISVRAGEKLDQFKYMSSATVTNPTGNSIKLLGKQTAVEFDYANNKEFTADEEITVTYGEASKTYFVDVALPTVNTVDLITNNAENVILKNNVTLSGSTKTYAGLAINSTGDVTTDWSAQVGGVFTGDASISYLGYSRKSGNGVFDAVSFTILDSQGKKVCSYVQIDSHWAQTFGTRGYLYNALENVYTSAKTVWKTGEGGTTATNNWAVDSNGNYTIQTLEVDTTSNFGLKKVGDDYNDMHIAPKLSSQTSAVLNEGGTDEGTLYFDYDEINKVMTVKVSSFDLSTRSIETYGKTVTGAGQIVPFGSVNVDLSEGYSIVVGNAPSITDAEGNTFTYAASTRILVTKINGVSLGNAQVEATGITKKVETDYEQDTEGNVLVKPNEIPEFVSKSTLNIGSLSIRGSEETNVVINGDISSCGAEATATVTDWLGKSVVNIKVKSLIDSIDVSMRNGAQIRTLEPYGIRFTMQMSADDKALLEANVGDGKEFVCVNYGMIIMPYDYIATYGHITEENLFGENAVYTWRNKTACGTETATIMNKVSKLGMTVGKAENYEDENTYYLHYAITDLAKDNITKLFVGAGYLEFVREDGSKEYKVVSLYDGYVEDGDNTANNVRSAYDVAKAAYEDVTMTNATVKQWLLDNYLLPNGYVVAE